MSGAVTLLPLYLYCSGDTLFGGLSLCRFVRCHEQGYTIGRAVTRVISENYEHKSNDTPEYYHLEGNEPENGTVYLS
jgi:hypothetical protein